MFLEAFEVFQAKFPPKQSLGESSFQLTTDEIMVTFENHGILEIETETMYQQLLKAGYKWEPIEDEERIVFKWLL